MKIEISMATLKIMKYADLAGAPIVQRILSTVRAPRLVKTPIRRLLLVIYGCPCRVRIISL